VDDKTILVVEDDDTLRQMAARALRNAGYCVVEAGNGQDALNAAEALGRFDLLITDVVMPKIGGLELARLLRARDPELRVVYMSGYSEDLLRKQETLESDASWIAKPFSLRELLHEARSGMAGRHLRRQVERQREPRSAAMC
jgi:two-component system cell cycle sensor histidine kinase/response regulator CckA